jgi:hypothetical protein
MRDFDLRLAFGQHPPRLDEARSDERRRRALDDVDVGSRHSVGLRRVCLIVGGNPCDSTHPFRAASDCYPRSRDCEQSTGMRAGLRPLLAAVELARLVRHRAKNVTVYEKLALLGRLRLRRRAVRPATR